MQRGRNIYHDKSHLCKTYIKLNCSLWFSAFKQNVSMTNYIIRPASITKWSKACTVYDRLNIEIAHSNPAQGMEVCPSVSVLCCPVFQ
jgi:hypothetical protein